MDCPLAFVKLFLMLMAIKLEIAWDLCIVDA